VSIYHFFVVFLLFSVTMSSPSPVANEDESPAQRQSRLRRERRQAKIAAGGTDRLKAITGVSGRQMPETRDDPGMLAHPKLCLLQYNI
jgi:hypothetical protein